MESSMHDLISVPIGEFLRMVADREPRRSAVAWMEDGVLQTRSYASLFDGASLMAAAISERATPGDRVAVWAQNSVDWMVLEYGAALAGAALVPLNPAFSDREVEAVVDATRPQVLFVQREFRGSPLIDRAAALRDRGAAIGQVVDLAEWRSLSRSADPLPTVDPDSAFLLQYTSGTTGAPKAAVLSHLAALNAAATSARAFAGEDGEIWCSPLPLHHVGGSVSVALSALSVGATFVIMSSYDANDAIVLLEQSRATILGAVPTMMIDILHAPNREHHDLSALKVVMIGGSKVDSSLIAQTESSLGVAVMNAYGQSEAPNLAQTALDDSAQVKAESIGRLNRGREGRVVSLAAGRDCRTGEVGELWVRSPMTMSGYYNDERTIETLDSDGWLHTGDLVSRDSDGVLRFAGRSREVIVCGGENIYPAEVEGVITQHDAVVEAAVVAETDDRRGEVPVAFVRLSSGATFDESSVAEFVRGNLAPFKVPRRWTVVDDFPRTAAGKIRKFELRS